MSAISRRTAGLLLASKFRYGIRMSTRAPSVDLREATALITGASGLIGGHVADALAERGSRLVLTDVAGDALQDRVARLRDRGIEAEGISCDLLDPQQLERLIERAEQALGPVDVLVNNAYVEMTSRFDRLSPEELDVQIGVNFRAPLVLTHAVLPGMLERGRGHVVNMASLTGKLAFAHKAHYTAAKAGLIGFSHALDRELAHDPVSVSVICPALVQEGGVSEKADAEGVTAPRLAATCSPREVAEAVVEAIVEGKTEITVTSRPTAVLSALQASAPPVAWRILRRSGMPRYWRKLAEARGRA